MKSPRVIVALNLIVLLATLGIAFSFWLSPNKIAYIDSNVLMAEYKGMIAAREAYQAKEVQWKANIDSLTQEVRQAITNFEKESPGYSAKEKELAQQLIQSKQQQLQQYQQAISVQAQQEDQQMTQRVLEQVNAYIEEYGKDHRYKVIMVATQMGNIAYADDGINITQEILAGLNKRYGNR